MTEKQLHKAVCQYIRLQYPNTAFHTDMSGVYLSGKWSLMNDLKANNSQPGFPDITIWDTNGTFNGLAIELKAEGKSPYLKSGELRNDEHLRNQAAWLERMTRLGWFATFAVGFDHAKEIIDLYFNTQPPKFKAR